MEDVHIKRRLSELKPHKIVVHLELDNIMIKDKDGDTTDLIFSKRKDLIKYTKWLLNQIDKEKL